MGVVEALQLLQDKTIDDYILSDVLKFDEHNKVFVVSLPNVKIDSFRQKILYRKICKQIFKYICYFSENKRSRRNAIYTVKNFSDEYVTTMRFIDIDDRSFGRMKTLLIEHIKKIFSNLF